MASLTPVLQSQLLFNKTRFKLPPNLSSGLLLNKFSVSFRRMSFRVPMKVAAAAASEVVSATTAEKAKKRYPGEAKGFVEEMRFVAMKLHTRDQAKEGEKEVKEPQEGLVAKWEPTVDGYLKFLVDSELVYDTLEEIVEKASFPSSASPLMEAAEVMKLYDSFWFEIRIFKKQPVSSNPSNFEDHLEHEIEQPVHHCPSHVFTDWKHSLCSGKRSFQVTLCYL
ncbi:unnamed protein product [Malus baccata var. baccata]